MAEKYLFSNAGIITEKEAQVASAGAGDAGKIVALGTDGKLDDTVMPTGIGADVGIVETSEALSAGDLVNVYNDSGNALCRKADATTVGKEADGFVKAAFGSGVNATIYFEGTNDQVTGLTPGQQFLSTTAGLCTNAAPTASGNVQQPVGIATSPTSLNFHKERVIVKA